MNWDWRVTSYYADDVAPPKKAGDLAIQTVLKGTASMEIELESSLRRKDIGRVTVECWNASRNTWHLWTNFLKNKEEE